MNILVTVNDRYAKYLIVMLTSLYKNNLAKITLYCLYNELSVSNQNMLTECVQQAGSTVHFIKVDKNLYVDFPTTEALSIECYFILLAHELLPMELDKILYLDSDLIIDGKLDDFYNCSFDDTYMVVCGQTYKPERGMYYEVGARPERGEYFNSGVLLMNLKKLRKDITISTYLDAARKVGYKFRLADQGILNIVFGDKVKVEDTLKYNFRLSIFEKFVREEKRELPYNPIIYHYVMHDNYKIGMVYKPWNLRFSFEEYQKFSEMQIAKRVFEDELIVKESLAMQDKWWTYAQMTECFENLEIEMNCNKEKILQPLLQKYEEQKEEELVKRNIVNKINLLEYCTENELKRCQYQDLEKYIDMQSPENAVQTMKNLFQLNLDRIRKQDTVKVGFVVYSSSEWQCEDLYRALENDDRFIPSIFICAYAHGKEEQIVATYKNTCKYFMQSKNKYNILLGGCQNSMHYRKMLDDFDIIFYFNSVVNLRPYQNNVTMRNLNQLMIYVPYGFHLINHKDAYYTDDVYNRTLFKMAWIKFATDYTYLEQEKSNERLQAYNIMVSGLPKMDAFMKNMVKVRNELWKECKKNSVRIIWAPHFNLIEGMNGTFHENYQWFYQYAKKHQEISWIVRPHPRMESGVLEKGVFSNSSEYKEYLNQWNLLPNARVIPYGDYLDIFSTSDAMILDSMSFVCEYQYTGKPLLFLRSNAPREMNLFGEELLTHMYNARGNDFEAIELFIRNILQKNDEMLEERRTFFDKYLDYVKMNGRSATEYIYKVIKNSMS